MAWRYVAPGICLVLVKLAGTSLFFVFIPQIFPQGNFSFVPEENYTVSQTTQSLPESHTSSPVTITTAAAPPVPELRWKHYQGNFYGFSESTLQWISSYSECTAQNSDLVIISDPQEMEFLQNETRNADYFIGLEYRDDENKWFWLDDTELKGNLFTMRPNEGNKQCATLRGREVSPASCYQENRWICEKKNGYY